MKPPVLSLALLSLLCHAACAEEKDAPKLAPPSAESRHPIAPEKTSDGWETASLSSVALDGAIMDNLLRQVSDGTYKNTHSILVIKNGKLVFEEYFAGQDVDGALKNYDRDTLHTQQSVSKSVNSILIGIAIDQHLIPGVEEKVSTYFPDYAALFQGGKEALRLRDCLSMSAGLAWVESGVPYTDPRNDAYVLNRSADPIRHVFDRSMAEMPGRKFLYNSGISIVLGEVLKKATGLPVDQFAERHLFGPLGITNYRWARLPNGSVHTGGGLFLRPRDMAKIGTLFLNGGRWQGKQIVSEQWVRESTRQQAPYRGYGYQWWLHTFRLHDRPAEVYAAQGLGGQFIIVIPDLQMVAVFTSWNVNARTEQPFEMLQQYIIPAAETGSSSPQP